MTDKVLAVVTAWLMLDLMLVGLVAAAGRNLPGRPQASLVDLEFYALIDREFSAR